jgi:acetyl-CoA carboxylase biotin carboxyl carrier protein
MELDDEDVRAILQLLDASAYDELQVETDRFKLTLRRTERGGWTRETRTLGVPRELADAAADGGSTAAAAEGGSTAAAAVPIATTTAVDAAPAMRGAAHEHLVAVATPLPGTFYRSPKPGAPPFVEMGTHVERDTMVAIVETMKLMNSVYAGTAGRIAEICLADGQFAAQAAVLMRIEPDAA